MVIAKLYGGLGNQMFQYACGRAFAAYLNTKLHLDIRWFHSDMEDCTPRKYELNKFNIVEEFAKKKEVKRFAGYIFTSRVLSKIFRFIKPKEKKGYIKERFFHFDSNIFLRKGDLYLDGYWQSEKYFIDYRDIIYQDFTLKDDLDEKNKVLADQITSCDSVSVHVRRNDYLKNQQTFNFHGVCSAEYYQMAFKIIEGQLSNPYYFVFSDDQAWASENLPANHKIYFISHNSGDDSYKDMWLISLCKHNIIANSSFSWWGAWLNRNPQKIVIAPQKWFKCSEPNTMDLMPDSWTKLPNS